VTPLGPSSRNRWRVSETEANLIRAPISSRPLRLEALPKAITIDLSATGMIVIDMQNDFCHQDGWLASIGVDVAPARTPIQPLAALLPELRAADVPVIWLNRATRPDRLNLSPALRHVYDPTGRGTGLGDKLERTGFPVLQAGSWSARIVDELTPPEGNIPGGDIHVEKHRMSGFWDTPLDSILRNLRLDTLLFGGVNLDQCVLHTLADANFLGFDTILVEDCAATTNPDFCREATLLNIRQIFGFTVMSADILKGLLK
jgi:ureidoacrylate peracid hydrolase